MKERHAIVAITENNAIGNKGKLIWRAQPDMKHFKVLTIGNTVIMGRKTYESIGSKPLEYRYNIVVTSNTNVWTDKENLFFVNSIEAAYKLAETLAGEKVFIIGGGGIYKETINECDYIDLTLFKCIAAEADTFFPNIPDHFIKIDESEVFEGTEKYPEFQFITYKNTKL
jgi:dihydrofolate reductase